MTDRTQNGGGYLVLVVDDDSQIRSYIRAVLQSARFRVLEAGDGVQALDVFDACRAQIDLVITDVRMPRLPGIDLAASLRASSPGIPIIFISGEPVRPGMNDPQRGFLFVEKPFRPKALLDAVHRLFRPIAVPC